jgi:hypothetical protein
MVVILLCQKREFFNAKHNNDEDENHGKNRSKGNPNISQTLAEDEEKDYCHDIEYQVWKEERKVGKEGNDLFFYS